MKNYNSKYRSVSIVGFGRFGRVLYRLLKNDFPITIYDIKKIKDKKEFTRDTTIAHNLEDIYQNNNGNVIFYAVPIENFEEVIAGHKKYFKDNHLLIDVLSIKMYPEKIFKKYLNGKTQTTPQAMLCHPMFGPDSSKNGFKDLPMIINKFRASNENYYFWKNYFKNKGLRIIEMSAREHDKLAASSQGLTHFIGRLLELYGLKPTIIDSLGTKKLLEVKEQICNDSWQLFTNLQHYNPHTKSMRIKLGVKYDNLYNKLLPKQINSNYITYGIQGGRGSFNEEAINYHTKRFGISNFKIRYLHTSARVLKSLHIGEIDIGQFAIQNAAGGLVDESIQAMADYKFKIVDKFSIKISHALMIRKDADFSNIDTIMTHPQALAQCKNALKKYSNLKQISGKGKLIDHAVVAQMLGGKKLPKNIATIGSKILAELYDLKIIEDNLQDLKENYTTFLHVKRM